MTRICLWSSPRNLSTALMYSFAQRSDTIVFDEPLYGYFLKHTGAERPGRDEVMEKLDTDGHKVISNILLGHYNKPVVFFKHLTNQAVDLDVSFMKEMVNLFFIRNPEKIIASFAEVIKQPVQDDVGIKLQVDYFNHAVKHHYKTIVLDAGDLLENTEGILTAVCNQCGITFEKAMLHWPAGRKSYDGCWAPYWYDNVHKSTGFERQATSVRPLPENLLPLYEESKGYYEYLKQFAIKAE